MFKVSKPKMKTPLPIKESKTVSSKGSGTAPVTPNFFGHKSNDNDPKQKSRLGVKM